MRAGWRVLPPVYPPQIWWGLFFFRTTPPSVLPPIFFFPPLFRREPGIKENSFQKLSPPVFFFPSRRISSRFKCTPPLGNNMFCPVDTCRGFSDRDSFFKSFTGEDFIERLFFPPPVVCCGFFSLPPLSRCRMTQSTLVVLSYEPVIMRRFLSNCLFYCFSCFFDSTKDSPPVPTFFLCSPGPVFEDSILLGCFLFLPFPGQKIDCPTLFPLFFFPRGPPWDLLRSQIRALFFSVIEQDQDTSRFSRLRLLFLFSSALSVELKPLYRWSRLHSLVSAFP